MLPRPWVLQPEPFFREFCTLRIANRFSLCPQGGMRRQSIAVGNVSTAADRRQGWFDIVIHPEEIGGVVFLFDGREAG
jgi:hypothetical protein